MDMGTDMSGMTEMGGSTMGGMMKPWLHFTLGDTLFFMGWVPVSTGAIIGACIGLFLLAIVERWVAAMRCVAQIYWARKTEEMLAERLMNLADDNSITSNRKRLDNDIQESEVESLPTKHAQTITAHVASVRHTAPFIPAYDFARGVAYACHAALSYALMLAIMTFHAGYLIAIVVGLGVGEILFGRFSSGGNAH